LACGARLDHACGMEETVSLAMARRIALAAQGLAELRS
jgi:hypothetical protein